jgi:hypothetical protein
VGIRLSLVRKLDLSSTSRGRWRRDNHIQPLPKLVDAGKVSHENPLHISG